MFTSAWVDRRRPPRRGLPLEDAGLRAKGQALAGTRMEPAGHAAVPWFALVLFGVPCRALVAVVRANATASATDGMHVLTAAVTLLKARHAWRERSVPTVSVPPRALTGPVRGRWLSGSHQAGDSVGGFADLGGGGVTAFGDRAGDAVAQVLLQQADARPIAAPGWRRRPG